MKTVAMQGHFILQIQIIQEEVEIEPEDLCETEEAKKDIAPAESITENIAPIKRERSPSLHEQKEEIKASQTLHVVK